jgi:hypothetical protein
MELKYNIIVVSLHTAAFHNEGLPVLKVPITQFFYLINGK